jgi:hypothetical protein
VLCCLGAHCQQYACKISYKPHTLLQIKHFRTAWQQPHEKFEYSSQSGGRRCMGTFASHCPLSPAAMHIMPMKHVVLALNVLMIDIHMYMHARIRTTTQASISVGRWHTCGVHTDGSGWCFGRNNDGRLGDGSITDRSIPVRVTTAAWRSISAGSYHSCGIQSSDDSAWCWVRAWHGILRMPGCPLSWPFRLERDAENVWLPFDWHSTSA